MRSLVLSLLVSMLFMKAGAVTITGLAFTKASYERYEKAEATFTLGTAYSNPYDTVIVQVDAEITPPSGPAFLVPCFYYVPCTYALNSGIWWESAENAGAAKWMLRYAPKLTGTYQVRIRVLDGTTSWSGSVSFNVTAGTRKGFVRIDGANNQFMRFDNGAPYYPVGYNICWNNGELVKFYNDWVNTRLAPNNANWMRYWFTDFARQALEWSGSHWSGYYSGLGRYSQRSAGILDSLLNNCSRQDVYVQLVLQHHGQFSNSVNPEWADNPYNTANGGPLNNPALFFSNATAKGQTKKLYRYIVARWGYSTNVMSWELFNEVEFSDGADADIDTWHDEMSRYLKYQDPNDHIVNTSCGQDNSTMPLFDNNPSMDQIQWHTYAGGIEKVLYTEANTFVPAFTKPVMCGEFGTAGSYTAHPDNWGDHVRKSMWIGMMSHTPNMFWYWDEYVQNKNLYTMFKPLADYFEPEDIVTNTGGVGKKIRVSTNPVINGSVQVTPTQGAWGGTNVPNNPFTSTVDASGNASNVNGLHRYLHGSWQGTRNRDLRFTVTFNSTATADFNVASVSGSGTKQIQVFIDGALATTWNPGGAANYTLTGIPAGTHVIRFFNNGEDWVEFNYVRFNNVSLAVADAWGYTGGTHAYGYISDISYGDWSDPASIPNVTGVVLRVGPLTPGTYSVQYWDPRTGATSSGGSIATTLDSITMSLPSFKKDLAYKVTPVSLPVDLLDFRGHMLDERHAQLQWSTASEINNDYFEVERSDDGKNFYPVGKINGGGNIQKVSSYQLVDPEPLKGVTYYRLRQTDFDGTHTYSNVIMLSPTGTKMTLYPNPVRDKLNVDLYVASRDHIVTEVYNAIGVQVWRAEHEVGSGNNTLTLDLHTLTPAIYYLKVTGHTSGLNEVQRFIRY